MMEADGMPLLLRFLVRIYGSEVRSNACAWQNSGGLIHPSAETLKEDNKGHMLDMVHMVYPTIDRMSDVSPVV
jgi:hypothetical protein